MRIRWRGLELPSRVEMDDAVSTEVFGRFTVEPFERGFGTTVGNSLRRILLSSLEGAAVTTVKIAGAAHEFTTIPGVLEDVTEIILNIKGITVASTSDEVKTMRLVAKGPGEVRAGDILADAAIEIINPEHLICTLTTDKELSIDMTVARGRGYGTAEENRTAELEAGVIPIDSVYAPVERVRYRIEDTRVGQRTNYDRLILDIWTRGAIHPADALVEAAKILRKHLNPFVMYHELGEQVVMMPIESSETVMPTVDSELMQKWNMPISMLNLSVRAGNCLESAKITTVGDLAMRNEGDLLRLRAFGQTSLREVRRKLAEHGLALGMTLDQAAEGELPAQRNEESSVAVEIEQN